MIPQDSDFVNTDFDPQASYLLDMEIAQEENVRSEAAKIVKATQRLAKQLESLAGQKQKKTPVDQLIEREFLERYSDDFVYSNGMWYYYHDGWWEEAMDSAGAGRFSQAVKDVCRSLGTSFSKSRVGNAALALSGELRPPKPLSHFPVMVFTNGTLEVDTGAFREHRRTDYAAHTARYAYDESVSTSRLTDIVFQWFYEAVPGHPEYPGLAADFLAGYGYATLLGRHSGKWDVGLWLLGPAGSGKSTLLEALRNALGDNAVNWTLQNAVQDPASVAMLEGKLAAIGTEGSTYISSQAQVLLSTVMSHETVTANRKYRPRYEFKPQCRIWWAMNRLPTLQESGTDGLRRRLVVLKYAALPEEQRDPAVFEYLMENPSAIIKWFITTGKTVYDSGRLSELQRRLQDITINQDYYTNQDVIALFLEEMCVVDVGNEKIRVPAMSLYSHYRDWCYSSGYKPLGKSRFYTELASRGLVKKAGRVSGSVKQMFFGIAIRED